jgi:hypothetical protein
MRNGVYWTVVARCVTTASFTSSSRTRAASRPRCRPRAVAAEAGRAAQHTVKPLANQPAIAEEAPRKQAAPVQVKKEPEKSKIPMASPIRTDMEVYRF